MKERYKRIKIVLFMIAIFLISYPIAVNAESKLEIPNLKRHVYVYDQNNIINDNVEQKVNRMLEEVEDKTTSEFFVITIKSLNNLDIEAYANKLFNTIGIGKKEENNGLLLLIYKDEDSENSKVRIEVGRGMEGFITDSISGRILDEFFVPYREKDQYSEATDYTVQALTSLIAKEYQTEISGITLNEEQLKSATEESDDITIPWPIILIIIILVILDIIFNGGDITLAVLYALSSGSSSSGRSGGGGRSSGGGASR